MSDPVTPAAPPPADAKPKRKHPLSAKQQAQFQARQVRMEEATKLALQGYSYSDIAAQMGISKAQAHRLVKRKVEREPAHDIEHQRRFTNIQITSHERRLIRIFRKFEAEAIRGDSLKRAAAAAGVVTRTSAELRAWADLRCRLNGLYAPTKHQIVGLGDGPIQIDAPSVDTFLDKLERIHEAKSLDMPPPLPGSDGEAPVRVQ